MKIETNNRHQVGQTSNIKVIQEKNGFITKNVSGETFGDLTRKCIDNSLVKVDIIKKGNNDEIKTIEKRREQKKKRKTNKNEANKDLNERREKQNHVDQHSLVRGNQYIS
ncbi:MAG: hypothetical protein ACKPFK_00895 [Dolichospermum sp.]